MSKGKKYDSTVSFQGKRLGQIQFLVETLFNESFLWIKVDHHNKDFIVFLSDKSDPVKVKTFETEFKQCKVRIFKEISLEELRNPCIKTSSR